MSPPQNCKGFKIASLNQAPQEIYSLCSPGPGPLLWRTQPLKAGWEQQQCGLLCIGAPLSIDCTLTVKVRLGEGAMSFGASLPALFYSIMPKGQFLHNSPAARALAEKVWDALFTAQLSLRGNLDQNQWENVARTKKKKILVFTPGFLLLLINIMSAKV